MWPFRQTVEILPAVREPEPVATPEPDRVEELRLKMAEADAALSQACKEKLFFAEMHGIRTGPFEVFAGCRHRSSRLCDHAATGWAWHVQNVSVFREKLNAAIHDWSEAKTAKEQPAKESVA